MVERSPVIAVDGPVGTGKGTVSQLIAVALGWSLLDSGAIYRLLALSALKKGLDLTDVDALVACCAEIDVRFMPGEQNEPVRVMLDGHEVTDEVRTERCGDAASRLAGHGPVRAALLDLQRSFRRPPGLVADGRDMGTVVFPDAELKLFLSASPEERAQRRHKQLIAKGIDVSLASLLADINVRDQRDSERSVAPLKPAKDAVHIDTSGHTIEQVFERVVVLVSSRELGEMQHQRL